MSKNKLRGKYGEVHAYQAPNKNGRIEAVKLSVIVISVSIALFWALSLI